MKYTENVLPILRQLRPILMPQWGSAAIVHQKDHSPVNIVTEADMAVEAFTSHELKKLYPDVAFVGEEQGGNRAAKQFWLMDPIDGTAHYVRGLPFCTSQLALIADGVVQFSAVYDFVNDIMYYAERGQGAYREGERLHVSSRSLADSYIVCETILSKEANLVTRKQLSDRAVLFNSISAGWEYAMIASGKLDARITADPYGNDYDFVPGGLLVAEAGGVVANLGSRAYDYKNVNFIAANPVIYKELTEGESAIFPT